MTSIANSGYSNLLSQAFAASGVRSLGKGEEKPGLFGHTVIDLSPEDLAYRREVRERSKEKIESGERWTRNALYTVDINTLNGYSVNKDAINKVREKLCDVGIDADKRTPTHEITDEQMSQLAEKYDLEYLSFAGMEDPEYGNLLLDLAYMNVFSLDDLENMYGVLEYNANHIAYAYIHPSDGSTPYCDVSNGIKFYDLDDILKYISMEYLKIKYLGRTENDYKEMTEDYIARKEERLSVIRDFFDRASQYFGYGLTNVVKPIIEDTSEKLKEDFGGIM